jgi:hypothetical protein
MKHIGRLSILKEPCSGAGATDDQRCQAIEVVSGHYRKVCKVCLVVRGNLNGLVSPHSLEHPWQLNWQGVAPNRIAKGPVRSHPNVNTVPDPGPITTGSPELRVINNDLGGSVLDRLPVDAKAAWVPLRLTFRYFSARSIEKFLCNLHKSGIVLFESGSLIAGHRLPPLVDLEEVRS